MAHLNVIDVANAEKDLTDALGRALVQWGVVEQRLCLWFHRITGMDERMARQIFYAVTSFNARTRMMRGAIAASKWPAYGKGFLETTVSKAITYDTFRNFIVHRETKFDANPASPTYKQYILVEGKEATIVEPMTEGAEVLTKDDLDIAMNNFRELARLIMDGYECAHDPARLQECHKLVHAMQTRAHSKEPNQRPLMLPPQPEASRA